MSDQQGDTTQKKNLMNSCQEKLEKIPGMKTVSDTIGIKYLILILIIGSPIVIYMCMDLAWVFVEQIIGILFPSYMSLRAVESKEKADDTQWLTYWVVYSGLHILDSFKEWIFFWIPYYEFVKLGLIVFMFLPQTKGAYLVYHYVIRPILTKYEGKIDKNLEEQSKKALEVGKEMSQASTQAALKAAVS